MNLKRIGKVFTSKSVWTGPSSYEKKNLPGRGLTKVDTHWFIGIASPAGKRPFCSLECPLAKFSCSNSMPTRPAEQVESY